MAAMYAQERLCPKCGGSCVEPTGKPGEIGTLGVPCSMCQGRGVVEACSPWRVNFAAQAHVTGDGRVYTQGPVPPGGELCSICHMHYGRVTEATRFRDETCGKPGEIGTLQMRRMLCEAHSLPGDGYLPKRDGDLAPLNAQVGGDGRVYTQGQFVPKEKIRERRCRLYCVADNLILTFLGGWKRGRRLSVPHFPDLPPDAYVEAVTYDQYRQQFVMRVWSYTFADVPPGKEIPVVPEMPGCLIEDVDVDAVPGLAVRKLNPRPGEVIVVRYPRDISVSVRNALADMCDYLASQLPENKILVIRDDLDIAQLPEDAMRAAGWVRADGKAKKDAWTVKVHADNPAAEEVLQEISDRIAAEILGKTVDGIMDAIPEVPAQAVKTDLLNETGSWCRDEDGRYRPESEVLQELNDLISAELHKRQEARRGSVRPPEFTCAGCELPTPDADGIDVPETRQRLCACCWQERFGDKMPTA